jgi:hypothetical protein
MKKIESIDSRMPFKFCRLRAQERVPEGLKFLTGAVLTLWVPTLIFCWVTGQAMPFYLMVCTEVLGVSIGILMYKKRPDTFPSCVPVESNVRRLDRRTQWRDRKVS